MNNANGHNRLPAKQSDVPTAVLKAVGEAVRDHLAEQFDGRLASIEKRLDHPPPSPPITLAPSVAAPAVTNEVHPAEVHVRNDVKPADVIVQPAAVSVTNDVKPADVHVAAPTVLNEVDLAPVVKALADMGAHLTKTLDGFTKALTALTKSQEATAGRLEKVVKALQERKPPTVNVAAPKVTVQAPPPVVAKSVKRKRVVTFSHDAEGNPTQAVVTEE